MGLNPEMHKNVIWNYYQAGHMMYIDSDSSSKLKKDIGEFLAGSQPTIQKATPREKPIDGTIAELAVPSRGECWHQ